jgi:molecular chaperone GrpE
MSPESETTREREEAVAEEAAAAEPVEAEEPAKGEAEAEAPEAEAEVEEPVDELTLARADAEKYLGLAQRTQADFDNFRKRAAREAAAAADRGVTRLAKELLPALDHLELALQAAEKDEAAAEFAKGVRLVQDEMAKALGRVGIEMFSPQGERFDPEQHEAMAQHPVEGAEPGTVVQVYQQGYRLNGSVLRPARVVVASAA